VQGGPKKKSKKRITQEDMDAVRVNLVAEFNLDDHSAEDLQFKQNSTASTNGSS
jgi:hypothetical protein